MTYRENMIAEIWSTLREHPYIISEAKQYTDEFYDVYRFMEAIEACIGDIPSRVSSGSEGEAYLRLRIDPDPAVGEYLRKERADSTAECSWTDLEYAFLAWECIHYYEEVLSQIRKVEA